MRIWLFTLFIVVSGIPLPAFASFSGNEVLSACEDSDPFRLGLCYGYVNGVLDRTLDAGFEGYKVCIPKSVTRQQLVDIVVSELKDKPEWRHYRASSILAPLLAGTFPCAD